LEGYKVTELSVQGGQWVIDLPIYGVCVVVDIWDDRVSLVSILADHPSEDDYELP
jgi:hypothetical protein